VSVDAIFNSKRAHKILMDYQGATVLDPVPGLHGGPDTWVQVLDFQSLYPSIIIAMLLCMMNLVLPDDLNYVLALEKAGKIPPLHRVKIDDTTTYYFSRNPNCIIASELRRLLEKRKGVKRVMKQFKKAKTEAQTKLDMLTPSYLELKKSQVLAKLAAQEGDGGGGSKESETLHAELVDWTNKLTHVADWAARDAAGLDAGRATLRAEVEEAAHQHKMQDVLQLSIKIVMNSFYGFFGVKEGMMPGMQPIAVATTFYGRDYIQRTKRFLQNLFDTHPDYEKLNMEVVYGDTDSVFVKTWPIPNLAEAIRIGEDMGLRTTRDEFRNCIILEFEKVANPHLAFEEKKSYIQRVWTCAQIDKGYIYISGVVEKRRDNSAFTRKMYHTCRESIIEPIPKGATSIKFDTIADIEDRSAQTLANELGKIEDDAVPLDDYVITKSLSRAPENYKQPVQAHVALALRIKDRIRRGDIVRRPPISGDRLPYVVCTHPTSAKVRDKVEDIAYFKDRGDKQIDRPYYVKASTKSLTQLYSSILTVKPFIAATQSALDFQRLQKRGQTSILDTKMGARTVSYQHLFKSRQRAQRKVTQLTLFGAKLDPADKKKTRKKKKRKKKRKSTMKFAPLF
jgi:DNA polymerase elongation subunit (family B)